MACPAEERLADNASFFDSLKTIDTKEEPNVVTKRNDGAEKGIQRVGLTLRGRPGSLLVVHAFAEKAKQEIRDKQQKKAKKAKEERNPQAEFEAAKYIDDSGRECAPVTAIKKALISAATAMDDLTKVGLRQALFVSVADDIGAMLVPIEKQAW